MSSNNPSSLIRTYKDRDGSRKENTVSAVNISLRRKTMVFNQPITAASVTGRRKTMFIDIPNIPTKNSKSIASSSSSTHPSGNIKKAPTTLLTPKNSTLKPNGHGLTTPLLPVKAATEDSHTTLNKRKLISDSAKLKHVPHREHWSSLNRSTFSKELHQAESPSHHSTSSTSTSSTVAPSSLRRDSSSYRPTSSSQRHSTSSESSVHRSTDVNKKNRIYSEDVMSNKKATKRRSSKDSVRPNFQEKKSRFAETETLPSVSVTKSYALKKLDPAKEAHLSSDKPNPEKHSDDHGIRKPVKSSSRKKTPVEKVIEKSASCSKESKRIRGTTTVTNYHIPQRKETQPQKIPSKWVPNVDPRWNPVVVLHRLKVDKLKKCGKDKREVILSDNRYTVYGVDGKIKIKNKKVNRQDFRNENQRISESVGKANDDVTPTNIETCNFSQQTEWRAFTRDFGVQKNDEEAVENDKKHKESINLFTQSVREYNSAVSEQQQTIDSLQQVIKEQKESVRERENKVAERERMIAERDLRIAEREQMIAERDARIAERDLKAKDYEEKIQSLENNMHFMALQVDSLKRSKESLFKSWKEQEAKLKELTKDKSVASTSGSNSKLSIRVKNIDELRGVSVATTASSQRSHTLSPNSVYPTNPIRNSTPLTENFTGAQSVRYPNDSSQSSPQPICSQPMQYLQMVTPPVPYMHMQNTQLTTTAVNTYTTQLTTSEASISKNTTPHHNLPRIIQRSATNHQPILRRPSNLMNSAVSNNAFNDTQEGSMQNRSQNISQLRNRAKTCYYGTHPILLQALQPHQAVQSHQTLQPHQMLQSQQTMQSQKTLQSQQTMQSQHPSELNSSYLCRR